MTFFSLILALVLEQLRPLPVRGWTVRGVRGVVRATRARFDLGSTAQGRIAWLLLVARPSVSRARSASGCCGRCIRRSPSSSTWWCSTCASAFATTPVLFSAIHRGAAPGRARGRAQPARGLAWLASRGRFGERDRPPGHRGGAGGCAPQAVWRGVLVRDPARAERGGDVSRGAAAGRRAWGARRDAEFGAFGVPAQRASEAIEWLPVRITATVFSMMGNFEDAIYCWRSQAVLWPERWSAILIASGGGALGVRLGMPVHEAGEHRGPARDGPGERGGRRSHAKHGEPALAGSARVSVPAFLLAVAGWAGR